MLLVVNNTTCRQENNDQFYKTHRGAKAFATRLNDQFGSKLFKVASTEFYIDVLSKRTTTVINLLTGEDATILTINKGTALDPSTEAYFNA